MKAATLLIRLHAGPSVMRAIRVCGACVLLSLNALIACSSPPLTQPLAGAGSSNSNLNLPPPALCPDSGASVAPPSKCTPGMHRDFASEVAPLFSGCGGEICHSFAAGGIADQIGVPATECCNQIEVIDPGHPESSYLLNKLSGRGLCDGAQMPIGRMASSAGDLRVLSDWICQGAHTNP